MSISLVSNTWLEENSNKIRSKPVPWEAYMRANLIPAEDLAMIRKVGGQSRQKMESLLLSNGPQYASLYLRLLKSLNRVDTMQYILVLIGDALTDHEERIPLFTRTAEEDPELPYGPLLRALSSTDEFLQLKAAQILTVLLCSEAAPLQNDRLKPFLAVISSLVTSQPSHKREISVQCLEALLARPEVRQAVWSHKDIIGGLRDILKSNPGPQMSYQVGFCFWLLTFQQDVAESLNKKYDIIILLTDIARAAVKEKVIRVVLATFRNLVAKAPVHNLPAMLVVKLLPFVNGLATRKWTDEDIVEDVQFLKDELKANFDSLTTYDEYTSELQSGLLSWSPVHESEAFWKENADKLNDKDYEQLKLLIKLLQEASDATVLSVAAHDIAQYVKYCDRGKKVVTNLGGKGRVMELMGHDNPNVRYQALVAVQNLVSHPWTV